MSKQAQSDNTQTSPKLIHAKSIGLTINNKLILNQIDIHLKPGEIVGLIGPNGAGKSSLLNVLAGIEKYNTGDYELLGQCFHHYKRKQLASILGYLPQEAQTHWPLTAKRIIELGRIPYQGINQKLKPEDQQAIDAAIKQTDTEHFLDRNINTLSGGERMRVLLARMFASQTDIVLADEPIAALDPYHQMQIMELLQRHAHQGGAVLVTLHDLNHAAFYCDRLVLIDQGEVVGEGSMQSLLETGILERVYNIDVDIFSNEQRTVIAAKKRR